MVNVLDCDIIVNEIYKVPSISFQSFFVQAFEIVSDSWKVSMLLLYIIWDDWPIFMISASNEQLQQQLEYTLLKTDCHSWWISKKQSGREDTLEERYAIKLCFEFGKNATETYEMLQAAFGPFYMNRVWVFEWHKRFKEGRESVRDDERCGRSKELAGSTAMTQRPRDRVPSESMLALPDPRRPDRANPPTYFWWSLFFFWQHWHDLHALGSHWSNSQQGILCWGFKGVQEVIPSEEASTLQIGSVAFPPGQCTSPQLHPCHRLFDQDGHQDSSSASL